LLPAAAVVPEGTIVTEVVSHAVAAVAAALAAVLPVWLVLLPVTVDSDTRV
jgi:hypothetical protein